MSALVAGASNERMTAAEISKAITHLNYALPTELDKHGFTLDELSEKVKAGAMAIVQMLDHIQAEKERRAKDGEILGIMNRILKKLEPQPC